MPQTRYSGAAGVYFEQESMPKTPDTVTGVPVLVGLARRGPLGAPTQLQRWSDFERVFGSPLQDSYLGYAVRGFFANRGKKLRPRVHGRLLDTVPGGVAAARVPFQSPAAAGCYVVRLPEISAVSLQAALRRLAAMTRIDLVCVPDLATVPAAMIDMQQMLCAHCLSTGDRFALLDAHPGANADRDAVMNQRVTLQGSQGSYAALYYPWIRVPKFQGAAGEFVLVPPCGDVAGVYSRTDARHGVHKAPANEELEHVVDISVNLSSAEQAQINPPGFAAVNCLRAFPGRGVRVWGARTLSTEPQWVQVNVRRLFIAISRWAERNMSDLSFEPHDARLWTRIVERLGSYLGSLHSAGALKGVSPEDAYYIKCDEETNPTDIRDAGRVVTELGIAPVVPGEFIVVRLVNADMGITLTAPTPSDISFANG